MNTYFPLFINIKEKDILVFGGGNIATRRIKAMLPYGACIRIIAPEISEELQQLAEQNGNLILDYRKYKLSELQKPDFVLAATNDEKVNQTIFRECRHKGILVNVASNRELCDFYFPGVVQQGDITVGITANGKNHKKAAEVTEQIRKLLG
ncbi:MAG: bifunctional precorrin-2 dehydrogenase/sirohydrochlorin ferrochelatase [Clostridiales bacterium]|uniref:precorrin-2 dehydrogenase/sirohydrochlorin ferrochelatase family protein n=1 Tax=Roseburia sp. MSJ-14 TaxID=2841514 RepID=UPI001697062B|nr:bifunctional precorrin-2 dehydrogenase/sirohydrochlorin ferrochelatase [Roseburia sp. MSJ-14]MBU5472117.1 bifunctional precorrin-2 dehydrogenase/sirohydrochlorin ferrochelatase [Roseburia sp. MSJ-14]NLK78674.1 bifunctional precorrin-2 dehydrogenase/sirohydrochlorin ferrochelatase [Clostridiales bacterium]